MQYIDLTPRWTEILPMWRQVAINNVNDSNFWDEMNRMAQAADNAHDLIAHLKSLGWADSSIHSAICHGHNILEIERNTIKESQDDMP